MNWRLMTVVAQVLSLLIWIYFLFGLLMSIQPAQSLWDNLPIYLFTTFIIMYGLYVVHVVREYMKGPTAQKAPPPFSQTISHLFSLITKNIGIITNIAYLAFMMGGLFVFVNSRVSWSLFDYVIVVAFSAVLIIYIIYGVLPRFQIILKSKSKKKD